MSSNLPWSENETIELVSLMAGEQSFCIEITQIRELRRWTPVTALPYAEAAVLGVMNLRGAVIPITDLCSKLGLGKIEPTSRHVVIVVTVANRTMGLLVDSVSEILSIKAEAIRPAPSVGGDEGTFGLLGILTVGEDMSRVLNLDELFPARVEETA